MTFTYKQKFQDSPAETQKKSAARNTRFECRWLTTEFTSRLIEGLRHIVTTPSYSAWAKKSRISALEQIIQNVSALGQIIQEWFGTLTSQLGRFVANSFRWVMIGIKKPRPWAGTCYVGWDWERAYILSDADLEWLLYLREKTWVERKK